MNKKVLITGSSKGIGKAIAKVLTEVGYDVCLTGRNEEELEKIAKEIGAKGYYAVDLLAENSVENDSDEKPEFTLECDSCTTTSSDETSSSTAGEWIVIPEQKYLYAITDYDESANVTKHSVKSFNTLQNDASTITENGITYEDYSATNLIELKDTAEADTHLWSTSPYRYDLYNFFVVGNNVFEQKDFYEYDTVNNTRKIKNTDVFVTADNDPKLLNNQNMYLQEDKEERLTEIYRIVPVRVV